MKLARGHAGKVTRGQGETSSGDKLASWHVGEGRGTNIMFSRSVATNLETIGLNY